MGDMADDPYYHQREEGNVFSDLPDDALEIEFKTNKPIRKALMTAFRIEVIGLTGPTYVKTPRGGYNSLEVAYKGPDGKVAGKKLVDFTNKEVFSFFTKTKSGDKVSVEAEKDANNFWQWNSAAAAAQAAEQEVSEAPSTGGGDEAGSVPSNAGRAAAQAATRGKVTGSNYETPDERAIRRAFDQLKHRQIGRQGCINSAIAYMNANFKEVTVEDVLETAEKFRAWSFKDE